MEISDYIATVKSIFEDARDRGVMFQTCEDDQLEGRNIHLHGGDLISFSSCSYLGLELHPALIEGACDAARRWGTQFSCSRAYLSAPPYVELESLLSELFGGHALVTSTTTLGHQSTLGALVMEKDAIVLDHQVHHSVYLAAQLARTGGARVELVRHNRLHEAPELVQQLLREHDRVWFCCDGVFSMYGDLAPVGLLQELLDISPRVRLYVDDAHGMSWTGKYGRGSFLSRMPQTEQIIVATSLCKAFGAGGAAIVFPTEEEREQVRMCGGPQIFSGPMQPPMIGAAIASAHIHLSPELVGYQLQLRERVDFCNRRLPELGLPLLVTNEAPIFFVQMGAPKVAFEVTQRMMADGYFINSAIYPAVPIKRSGIRLALTSNHRMEDIEKALDRLQYHAMAVLKEEGVSLLALDQLFASQIPQEALRSERYGAADERAPDAIQVSTPTPSNGQAPGDATSDLTVQHLRSIHQIDKALWNRCMGHVGACSWNAMACWEQVFSGNPRKESNWDFHYILVSDAEDTPVCATFFTTPLLKDDMMMREQVSSAVEQKRQDDPYFLTSTSFMMGSLCSEGNHLYLDRKGPWQAALKEALEVVVRLYESAEASMIMLRDLPNDDPEMDAFMRDHGFFKTSVLDRHGLDIDWRDEQQWLQALDRDKRRYVRKYMLKPASAFEVQIYGAMDTSRALSDEEYAHLFGLYRNVAGKKLRINVFEMPESILPTLMNSPAWELVTFRLPVEAGGPKHGRPVGFYVGHIHEQHYTPFFCGLDYEYVSSHGTYRQLLAQVVRRSKELGMEHVHFGMDADFIKSRLGTQAEQSCAYLQVRDHFQGTLLREIVAEVAITEF